MANFIADHLTVVARIITDRVPDCLDRPPARASVADVSVIGLRCRPVQTLFGGDGYAAHPDFSRCHARDHCGPRSAEWTGTRSVGRSRHRAGDRPAGRADPARPGDTVPDSSAGRGPHRFEGAAGPDPVPQRDRGIRLGLWRQPRLPQGARDLLAHEFQLARAGTEAQSAAAIQDYDRWRRRSLRPPAIEQCQRHAARHDPRMAGIDLRVHQGNRPADRAGQIRRQRERCVPRRGAVVAGLRVFGQAAHPRLQQSAHRADHCAADVTPWLHPLRRARRRLGRDHRPSAGAGRSASI